MIQIRSARLSDAAAVAELYAVHVARGVGTFEEIPPDPQEMRRRMAAVAELNLPFLLAETAEGLAGFAYASPFRMRSAYRYIAEDSVYVAAEFHGRGVGKRLLSGLIEACEGQGLRQPVAVIGDSANEASVRLHESMGFLSAGALEAVGYKHGRWLDIVFMQRPLSGGAETPPVGTGLSL